MTDLQACADRFTLKLCTGTTEYVVEIQPTDTSIYCAVSFNTPTEMGLL